MAIASRALIRGRIAAKRSREKRLEDKRREAIKQKIMQFPEAWLDLQKNLELVQKADLTKPENSFLVVERIENGQILKKIIPGKLVENVNLELLQTFSWVDSDLIRFTAFPITEKYVNAGMFVRFLVWSKDDSPDSALMKIYSTINENTMYPENPVAKFEIQSNTLMIVDVFISGNPKEIFQYYFLMLFSYIENTNSREEFITIRIKANFEREIISFDNYTEIKGSSFLNNAKRKHIHPVVIKTIVKKQILGNDFSIKNGRNNIIKWSAIVLFLGALLPIIGLTAELGFFFWIVFIVYLIFILFFGEGILGGIAEVNLVKKSRKLLLIDNSSKDTKKFNPLDRTWLIDYCDISEYWSFNPEIEDISFAFNYQEHRKERTNQFEEEIREKAKKAFKNMVEDLNVRNNDYLIIKSLKDIQKISLKEIFPTVISNLKAKESEEQDQEELRLFRYFFSNLKMLVFQTRLRLKEEAQIVLSSLGSEINYELSVSKNIKKIEKFLKKN